MFGLLVPLVAAVGIGSVVTLGVKAIRGWGFAAAESIHLQEVLAANEDFDNRRGRVRDHTAHVLLMEYERSRRISEALGVGIAELVDVESTDACDLDAPLPEDIRELLRKG